MVPYVRLCTANDGHGQCRVVSDSSVWTLNVRKRSNRGASDRSAAQRSERQAPSPLGGREVRTNTTATGHVLPLRPIRCPVGAQNFACWDGAQPGSFSADCQSAAVTENDQSKIPISRCGQEPCTPGPR